MTDIVERLRNYVIIAHNPDGPSPLKFHPRIADEAADEIALLRVRCGGAMVEQHHFDAERVSNLVTKLRYGIGNTLDEEWEARDAMLVAADEIERLRARALTQATNIDMLNALIDTQYEEIECLRARYDGAMVEQHRLDGEVERLQNWEAEARAAHQLLFEKDAEIENLNRALDMAVTDVNKFMEPLLCDKCGEQFGTHRMASTQKGLCLCEKCCAAKANQRHPS